MQADRRAAMALSATHLTAGLALLLLSGWFIAASAVAGLAPLATSFNYVIPAAMIRFLALIRILAGYGEKYFGHSALLDRVNHLRLAVFDAVMHGSADDARATELERLSAQTDALASRDIAATFPIVAAGVLAVLLALLALLVFPPLLLLQAIALPIAGLIAFWQWRSLRQLQQQLAEQQAAYSAAIEHYLGSVSLWYQGNAKASIDNGESAWRSTRHALRQTQTRGDSRLTALALLLLVWAAASPSEHWLGSPYLMLGLFFCLSLPDWLGAPIRAMSALAEAQHAANELDKVTTEAESNVPSEESTERLSVDDLVFSQLRPQREHLRCSTLDLTLKRGEIAFIQGSSGSGKSSLLLAIAGLLPQQGTLYVNGQDAAAMPLPTRRRNLLYVEQFPMVLADTLRQNLLLAAPEADDATLGDALRAVGLENVLQDGLNQWLGETGRLLSGGEKKRLGLARALLSDAPIWLLDEPFEGLDQAAIQRIAQLLNRERAKRILMVVSHQPLATLSADYNLSLDS